MQPKQAQIGIVVLKHAAAQDPHILKLQILSTNARIRSQVASIQQL